MFLFNSVKNITKKDINQTYIHEMVIEATQKHGFSPNRDLIVVQWDFKTISWDASGVMWGYVALMRFSRDKWKFKWDMNGIYPSKVAG